MSSSADESLSALLEYIRSQRGIDFGSYKESSLGRRLQKRMSALGIEGYAAYLDHLQATPDEFTPLLETLFINVTQFFRDPEAWSVIREKVVPEIVGAATSDRPIRVWCAGAATGEEPYSMAILLAEQLGQRGFTERVKIYATDLDEGALGLARHGIYPERQLENIGSDLRARYFEPSNGDFAFRVDLRRCIIFGRHNLLEDAPISRLDLLICRNTLMYFNREAQNRILARFHFALRDPGYLFLGKAEMLLTRRHMFAPVDGRVRVFEKLPTASLHDRLAVFAQTGRDDPSEPMPRKLKLREFAFDGAPVAQLVVDSDGTLMFANAAARQLFGVSARDNGRPFYELEMSYRPLELRALIEEAKSKREVVTVHGVESAGGGRQESSYFDVRIAPIGVGAPEEAAAVSITFADVTHDHRMREELEHSRGELETAYEELQSTNEELETTNEELQSTIEELETTNEELQSTNEELETMNEELQSTNEEIRTVNEELHDRTEAVDRLNAYMRSILNSVNAAVVVLDADLRVHLWSEHARDMWGLRQDEVAGQPFLHLDIGLPVAQLKDAMRGGLQGDYEETLVNAHNRRGKQLECRVTVAPLHGLDHEVSGVILMMEEWPPSATEDVVKR